MSPSDRESLKAGQQLWEMYLREIRPYVWRRAQLYALARPLVWRDMDGRLVVEDRHLPELVLERIEKLNALIEKVARRYGIVRMPTRRRAID